MQLWRKRRFHTAEAWLLRVVRPLAIFSVLLLLSASLTMVAIQLATKPAAASVGNSITATPNIDGNTSGTWTPTGCSAGSYYSCLSDDPAVADQASYLDGPDASNTAWATEGITDTPSDFKATYAIRIKAYVTSVSGGTTGGTDNTGVTFQVVGSDDSTALSAAGTNTLLTAGTWSTINQNVAVASTNTKAAWDGARIKMSQTWSAVGGADTTAHVRVSAVRVYLTYVTNAGKLTQVNYLWQNDDGSGVDNDTNQAAYNTAITSVRRGERLTLRAQISNTGTAFGSDLALFYDRNDGMWSKVRSGMAPVTANGSCSGDNNFSCATLHNGLSAVGRNAIATDPQGRPWVSYYDTSGKDLWVATYVGTKGSGCGTNTAWNCVEVTSTGDVGSDNSIGIDPNGKAWISYVDVTNSKLMVAEYVGGSSGTCGSLGGSAEWNCTTVTSLTRGASPDDATSISIDPAGTPWIAMHTTASTSLYLLHYMGSAYTGDCTSTQWDGCTTAVATNVLGMPSLAFDGSGVQWMSYYDSSKELEVVKYVGTGGSCTNTAYSCMIVESTTQSSDTGQYSSIGIGPDGNAWVSYYDAANKRLKVAKNVSGANCNLASWTCWTPDTSATDVGKYTSMAFDPSGRPWVSYYDATNTTLKEARYTASSGSCSGSTAWNCSTVDSIASTDIGAYSSITFDGDGHPWITDVDNTNHNLRIVTLNRDGEIVTSPGLAGSSSGAAIAVSKADATPATADCSGGGTFNNGKWFTSENGSGITLPDGSGTAQCTEVAWVIDTSQTTTSTAYRFAIGSATALRPDKGQWRGPITITNFPKLTTDSAANLGNRISKDTQAKFSACTDTTWGCDTVDTSGSVGVTSSVAFDASGNAWVVYNDSTNHQLKSARYVGTGGSGCADSAWSCEAVDTLADPTNHPVSLRTDPDGNAWASYYDGTNGDLRVAHYVGSSGTGCGGSVTDWTCVTVDGSSIDAGLESSLAIDNNGSPWVSYYDGTNADLKVAHYVGSGGSGCDISSWSCTSIATTNQMGHYSSIAIGPGGSPWVSYRYTTNGDLYVARYVGSAGTGCAVTTWTCQNIDDNGITTDVGTYTSLAFDASGKAWVSYRDETNKTLKIAHYVSSGGSGCAVGASWDCVTAYSATDVGSFTSIAMDSDGNPWVSSVDNTNAARLVSHCVQTAGKCAAGAWTTSTIYGSPTGTTAQFSGLAFDASGTPWISMLHYEASSLMVAKMNLSPDQLSTGSSLTPGSRDAAHGDGRYRLDIGHSPRTETATICSANTNSQGYCGLATGDSYSDSMPSQVNEQPVFSFAMGPVASYTTSPTATWSGKSTVAPSSKAITMQVYRWGTTNAWETVTPTLNTCSSTSGNTWCTITAQAAGTTAEYYTTIGGKYWSYWRVYQAAAASTETLRTDSMSVSVTNVAPNTPTALAQYKSDGTTSLSTGSWTNETTVVLKATVSDPNNPDTDQLCVEIQPLGTAFTNSDSGCGAGVAYSGSGVTASITVTGLVANTQYHWQARTLDAGSLYSSWTSYGGNAESAADVGVDTTAPTTATVYDGTSVGTESSYNNGSLSQLSANWNAFTDTGGSGLLKYQYSIGTTAGATDIVGWTDNGTAQTVTASSLTLHTNQIYFFNVRAYDNVNNLSSVASSSGQLVAPTLTFSNSTSVPLANLNPSNSYISTSTVNLTVSTNAYSGYVVRQFSTQSLLASTGVIPAYSATYPSSTAWSGTGFGYTSNDSSIQGLGDVFGSGTKYVAFSTATPGDIVADHTSTVSGSPISNEQWTITLKVATTSTQVAGTYTTKLVYSCLAAF